MFSFAILVTECDGVCMGVVMFKKYIFLLVILGMRLGAMNTNHVVIGGTHRGDNPEFFTSFRTPDLTYRNTLLTDDPITNRIPLIGHYQNEETRKSGKTHGEFYNLRARIALIEHEPVALARVIPVSVRTALANAGINDLSAVEFYTNILGDFVFPEQAPFGGDSNSCNVAFHPVLIRWRNTDTAHFNTPVSAGIFEANGISPKGGGIAFGQLGKLDVNYHGAFSPDNGRFNYDPSKGIATFWVVGVYQGHAIVVFNIMALNPRVERLLLDITRQKLFNDVLRVMKNIPKQLMGDDVATLTSAVRVLELGSGYTIHPLPVVRSERAVAPAPMDKGHALGGKVGTGRPSDLAYRAAMRRAGPTSVSERAVVPVRMGREHALGRKVGTERPSDFAYRAAMRRAGPSSVVDTSIVDDMTQAFMDHLQQGNITEAISLLEAIENIDPDKAVVCRIALEEHLNR